MNWKLLTHKEIELSSILECSFVWDRFNILLSAPILFFKVPHKSFKSNQKV